MSFTYKNSEERLIDLILAETSFLTFNEKNILKTNIDSLSKLAVLSIDDISLIVRRTFRVSSWDGRKAIESAKRSARILDAFGIKMILHESSFFPPLLKEIINPPYALFCRGEEECLLFPSVSVVGTRRMTMRGKMTAFSFAKDASAQGFCVVSGLAYGVDGEAHRGALDAKCEENEPYSGKTVAVLPCGCDMIVPGRHKGLAKRILTNGGALVSEYVPGVPSESWRFVHRNRIIAALSGATVVIESPPGSGALHTAQFALDYNREVFFHECALSQEAKKVSCIVLSQLKKDAILKNGVNAKMENTVERYIEEGAPVIKNFADCLERMNGFSFQKVYANEKQGVLF
ncbi:MAG: DNA-processing protein DprA [Treponema sp.]|nr:DNA-processing protein DprA [Treponema sp.]